MIQHQLKTTILVSKMYYSLGLPLRAAHWGSSRFPSHTQHTILASLQTLLPNCSLVLCGPLARNFVGDSSTYKVGCRFIVKMIILCLAQYLLLGPIRKFSLVSVLGTAVSSNQLSILWHEYESYN